MVGVMPEHLVSQEIAHRGLTELRVVASMHERKQAMEELSDGFLCLPGGPGTFEEIFAPQGSQRSLPRCANAPVGQGGICENQRSSARFMNKYENAAIAMIGSKLTAKK